ncbi:MAG: DUF294 nucleotidyltransferase-like domain-containing protein, partial [Kineosporiaceae bacterium]
MGVTDLDPAPASRDLKRERLALALRFSGDGPELRGALTDLVQRALGVAWREALAPTFPGTSVPTGPSGRTPTGSPDGPPAEPSASPSTEAPAGALTVPEAAPGDGTGAPLPPGPDGLALAVVGSVARRETGPASDLDLVLVHDGRSHDADTVSALADRLWYPLWDAGLRLDHAVRTVNQCREVSAADLSAAIGMLDLRPLAGDAGLVVRVRAALLSDWRSGIRRRLPALLDSLTERG